MDLTFRRRKARRKAAGKNPIEFEVECDPPINVRRRRLNNKDFSDLLTNVIMTLKDHPQAELFIRISDSIPQKYAKEVETVFRQYSQAEGVKVSYQ